jgi:hypothetical protein
MSVCDGQRGPRVRALVLIAPDLFNVARQLVHEAAYGERSPLGTQYAEDLHELTQNSINGYVKKHFHGSNIHVYGTNIAHEELVKLANTHFKNVTASKHGNVHKAVSAYAGGEMRVRKVKRKKPMISFFVLTLLYIYQAGSHKSTMALAFPIPDGKDGMGRLLFTWVPAKKYSCSEDLSCTGSSPAKPTA